MSITTIEDGYYWARKQSYGDWEVVKVERALVVRMKNTNRYNPAYWQFGNKIENPY